MVDAPLWAEWMELAGTVLAAIPALRMSSALLRIHRTAAAVDRPDVPAEIVGFHRTWRDAMMATLQGWNRFDHVSLVAGVLLLVGACATRIVAMTQA